MEPDQNKDKFAVKLQNIARNEENSEFCRRFSK